MSVSAHKLYGPKGIGAAFVSRHTPFRPLPVLHGGGQEDELRPGTLPTCLCVGFGAACEIPADQMGADTERLVDLRGRFLPSLENVAAILANLCAFQSVGLFGDRGKCPACMSRQIMGDPPRYFSICRLQECSRKARAPSRVTKGRSYSFRSTESVGP